MTTDCETLEARCQMLEAENVRLNKLVDYIIKDLRAYGDEAYRLAGYIEDEKE